MISEVFLENSNHCANHRPFLSHGQGVTHSEAVLIGHKGEVNSNDSAKQNLFQLRKKGNHDPNSKKLV